MLGEGKMRPTAPSIMTSNSCNRILNLGNRVRRRVRNWLWHYAAAFRAMSWSHAPQKHQLHKKVWLPKGLSCLPLSPRTSRVARGLSSYSFKLMQCGGGKQRNIPFVATEGTDIGISVMLGVDYQSLDHHDIPEQTTESIENHNDYTISVCNKLQFS